MVSRFPQLLYQSRCKYYTHAGFESDASGRRGSDIVGMPEHIYFRDDTMLMSLSGDAYNIFPWSPLKRDDIALLSVQCV